MQDATCLFCRIAARTVPAEIVAESNGLLAFKDIRPQAPVHLLVIPMEHIASLTETSQTQAALLSHAVHFATELAQRYQIRETGYRLVINTGPDAGQSVNHLHLHLLGGRALRWPPG